MTKSWSAAAREAVAAVIAVALALGLASCGEAKSEAMVRALQAEDVAAYWAVRGKDQDQNNYIHPVVRFRIHNSFAEEVSHIQAMAVFKRERFPEEPWGNDFLYSISEGPIPSGGASDWVTLRSDTNFISKDSPERMFQNERWEEVLVAVFLRVGPSSWQKVLETEVPKSIGAPGLEKFLGPGKEP